MQHHFYIQLDNLNCVTGGRTVGCCIAQLPRLDNLCKKKKENENTSISYHTKQYS